MILKIITNHHKVNLERISHLSNKIAQDNNKEDNHWLNCIITTVLHIEIDILLIKDVVKYQWITTMLKFQNREKLQIMFQKIINL